MAKYNIMGYEVEIKAKQPIISSHNNKKDELSFVNTLICMMYECAERAEMKAEKSESFGSISEMEVYADYKQLMLKYARELTEQYKNEKR